MRVVTSLTRRITALPAWLQPPAVGAVILFAIVAFRVLLVLPGIILHGGRGLGASLAVLAVATGAGAAGGLAYSFIGRPLWRIPVVGRYLAGMVCVAAYLTPLLLLFGNEAGKEKVFDFHVTSVIVLWLSMVALFGIVIGQSWFKPDANAASSATRPDGSIRRPRR
ncbi:MAG: hypothetical protein M3Y05_16695 [Gemmatimonadota bacterium]|nr:hypothetical protein [Gemmatimonadota bacterium]